MKKIIVTFAPVLLALSYGCSSIVNGTTQKVSINSNVKGAEVLLNGQPIGKTPVVNAIVKRKDTHLLMLKKEGYKDHMQTLNTKMDPWFWGNILIGGLIGSTTDTVSGTTHLLDPDSIYIELERDGRSSAPEDEKSGTSEIRSFVMNSYTQLIKDIKSGSGDYLKSLFKLMKVEDSKKKETLEKLKPMTQLYDTVHEFTEEVIKLYQK